MVTVDPVQVLAVVQYFQNRDAPENQEDEIWSKMRNAGPVHEGRQSPAGPDMSRENSREGPSGRVEQFANPVSDSYSGKR